MKNELAWALSLALSACADPTATVELALSAVPPTVATIGVSVRNLDDLELVASATIAAPSTSFVLGVPAEVPLEFFVVASTNRPGPPSLLAMPAYVGRVVHAVPLGASREVVGVTVHRAGVLSIFPDVEDGSRAMLDAIRLTPLFSAAQAEEAAFDRDAPPSRSLILRTGRWDASAMFKDGSEAKHVVATGRGLYVAPETESVATLVVTERPQVLPVSAPVALRVLAPDLPRARSVATRPEDATPLPIAIEAVDVAGKSADAQVSSALVTIIAQPSGIVVGPSLFSLLSLPARIDEPHVIGQGRLVIQALARTEDGREIRGELALNVLPEGMRAGVPETMELSISDPMLLPRGTDVVADVLDGQGLFAEIPVALVDFSLSDPWAFFPSGPMFEVRDGFGRLRREVVRSSGPHGFNVTLRATLTSTASSSPVAASFVLPVLTIPSP